MCDTGNFHALYFDPTKAGVMQPGLFPHPCLPDADPKANKKGSSGKDGLAMMGLTRQNQVGNVMLYGTPIVSLFIDGQERLCLAQISNTLLKDYSYNEIHNRRVALGITCLQCTPVQLEILRRAGAMPVSSRRCGLITKREAERLVKSFLEDIAPPQLPEDFKFEVYHECGWGCRGSFLPSRYNSSRAKCIECHFCKGYFSPNKFIFHYHRSHSASYRHPDAANFNSWRRHLKLCDQAPSDGLVHAWEDVKAMFNGGSRKRMLSSPTKAPHSPKIPALSPSPTSEDIGFYSFPTSSSSFPYYPYMSAVADPLHFQRLTQGSMHPAFPRGVNCPRSPSFQSYGDVLRSLSAPYTMMWMQQPSYPKPDMNYYTRPCDGEDGCPQEPKSNKPSTTDEKKQSGKDRRNQTANKSAANSEIVDSSSNDSERYKELPLSDHTLWKVNTAGKKDAPDSGKIPGSDDEGPIEVVEEESKGGNAADKSESGIKGLGNRSETQTSEIVDSCSSRDDKICKQLDCHDNPGIDSSGRISEPLSGGEVTRQNSLDMEELLADNEDCSLSALDVEMASVSSGGYSNMPLEELQNLLSRAKKAREQAEKRNLRLKGSLEDTLRREARIKQELTEQISAMRGNYRDVQHSEKPQGRNESVIDGSLCSEIEQERKAKELIQMRLKGRPLEVHDALQHISCGLQPDGSDPCSCKGEKADNSNHSA